MSQEFINPSDGVIRQYLATSKTLAVVGCLTVKKQPVIE